MPNTSTRPADEPGCYEIRLTGHVAPLGEPVRRHDLTLHEIGLASIADGTVCLALARLEREKRVTARLVASKSGPARKYYRPTPAGYDALATGTADWRSSVAVVDPVLAPQTPAHPAPPTEDN